MANTEEQVSKLDVDRFALVVTAREDDLKIHAMTRLVGERYAYEAVFKVSREFLNADSDLFHAFFVEAEKAMRQVLNGEKELNAVTA